MGGLVYLSAFAPVSGAPAAYDNTCPENAGEKVNRLIAAGPVVVFLSQPAALAEAIAAAERACRHGA
ncbi:hypothetical protein [Streptomyces decoyicus]|uniref:hypothetical protein n=1 Tax=Streptomyces decoyicus TaxID=249567 RepID=UPI0033B14780